MTTAGRDALTLTIAAAPADLPRPSLTPDVTAARLIVEFASYDDLCDWTRRGEMCLCGDLLIVDGALAGAAILGQLPGGHFVTVRAPLPASEVQA